MDNKELDISLEDFNEEDKNHIKETIKAIIDDYKATMTPPAPTFRPKHFKCGICQEEIFSQYPGHFSQCKCGKSFVSQDEFLIRMGGNIVELHIRNPDRIKIILDRLQKAWETFPDMRLGQLMESAIGEKLFYIEDEELVNQIDLFLNDIKYEQIKVGTVS